MSGPQVQLTAGGALVGVGLIVGGLLAWKAYAGARSGLDSLAAGWRDLITPTTPAEHQANYGAALEQAQAGAAAGNGWNPFVNNPNNFAPADLVPAGYTVNQYGDLVKTPTYASGGGGVFNGNGASGTW